MPLKMRIASFETASAILNNPVDREDFTHVVSIGMPSHTPVPYPCDLEALGKPYLRLEFDDIPNLHHPGRPPTWGEINRLINCLRDVPDGSNLLFHCHAGQSRSGAAALIYAYLKLKSEKAAVQYILDIRTQARPNRLMLVLADAILGSHLLAAVGERIVDGWCTCPTNPDELRALGVPGK
jgi:predicted protein tyrosine phosphatase